MVPVRGAGPLYSGRPESVEAADWISGRPEYIMGRGPGTGSSTRREARMALDLDEFFARVGLMAGGLNEWNANRGAALRSRVAGIVDLYEGDADEATADGFYAQASSAESSGSGWPIALKRLAQRTLVEMVRLDDPRPDLTVDLAIDELVAQMAEQDSGIAAVSVGASVAAASTNRGNPAWVFSTKEPRGRTCAYAFAEDLECSATADSQPGGAASAGREPVVVRGEYSTVDILSPDWPQGSRSQVSLTAIDCGSSAQGGFGQWLRNGNFAAFDAVDSLDPTLAPTYWTVEDGDAGVDLVEGSSSGFDDSVALAIVGDGATNVSLYQEFGSSSGTPLSPEPLSQYTVCLFAKMSAAPLSGALQVALVDGEGNVTADEQGAANSFTVDLTSLGTSLAARSGCFRTPRILPAVLRLRLRLTTTLPIGRTLYVDEVGFSQAVPLYQGGPSASLYSGRMPIAREDSWTIAVTNSATETSWHRAFDRLFDGRARGKLLREKASPDVSDALIT